MAVGVVVVLGAWAAGVSARTLTVDSSRGPHRTLQSAVRAARSGDTILLPAGVFTGSITLARSVTIQGAGREATLLDGGMTRRVCRIRRQASVVLRGLGIRNGCVDLSASRGLAAGAGILNEGALRMENAAVSGCFARGGTPGKGMPGGDAEGAGIFNLGSLVLSSTRVADNRCEGGCLPYYSPPGAVGSGGTARGGGILNRGVLYLVNATVHGNSCAGGAGTAAPPGGAFGGGIHNENLLIAGEGTLLSGNSAWAAYIYRQSAEPGPARGGALYSEGFAILHGVTALSNALCRWGDGGAVYNRRELWIAGGRLAGNAALRGGGLFNAGRLIVQDLLLEDNIGDGYWDPAGGGVYNGGTCETRRCEFRNNRSFEGGGVRNEGWMRMEEDLVASNGAFTGGGIFSTGILELDACELAGNRAGVPLLLPEGGYWETVIAEGGGLYNAGALTGTDSALHHNLARSYAGNPHQALGGGVADCGTSTWVRCAFDDNTALGGDNALGGDAFGGGILVQGDCLLNECTIASNRAVAGYGHGYGRNRFAGGECAGAGMLNRGRVLLENCTISGNYADGRNLGPGRGGGIANHGTLSAHSCTVCDNRVDGSGGVREWAGMTQDVSGRGGGIHSAADTLVRNCLVAGNSASISGPDLEGTLASDGFNLVSVMTTNGIVANTRDTDLLGVDPRLGPLADHGGPTRTHLPLPGSPAIDRGAADHLVTDQRGMPRPADNPAVADALDGADIGAVEVQ